MDFYQRIAGNFQQVIDLIAMSVDAHAIPIEDGSQLMANTLLNDGKIFVCGNGADAAVAQLFVNNLISCFEHERPALPAICLTSNAGNLSAIATSSGLNEIYSRQIRALGQSGDVILCISSADVHPSLNEALRAARDREMSTILLSHNGEDHQLLESDVAILIGSSSKPRIVELHTMITNLFCEMIESHLFGSYEQD